MVDQAKIEALTAVEGRRFEGRPASFDGRDLPRYPDDAAGVPMSWMDELYDHPPLWVSHGRARGSGS